MLIVKLMSKQGQNIFNKYINIEKVIITKHDAGNVANTTNIAENLYEEFIQ